MKISPIHQSAEQRLAESSQGVLSIARQQQTQMEEMTRAVEELAAKDTRDPALQDVTRKLEEMKSASLITNRLLKDISMKEPPSQVKMELTNKPNELASAFFSMLKGDKGDAPTPQEIVKLIKPLIPKPIKGDPGDAGDDYVLTDEDKREIAQSIKVPVVEKLIEKIEIIREQPIVTNEIREVAMRDEPNEIIEKINVSKKKIDAERVRGLAEVIRIAQEFGSNTGIQVGGGANQTIFLDSTGARISDYVTTIKFSSNLTTSYSNGVITVTASGSGGTGYQSPTGTVNGSNTTFVFSVAPSAISVDGTVKQKTSSDGTVNWTGTQTITLAVAPTFDVCGLA